MNLCDNTSIQIAYNILKYKFDKLKTEFNEIETINPNIKKVRILFLDLTFIYNFLFGYFLDYKNPNKVFDNSFLKIHSIEILNLIAHYRRFFNKIKSDYNAIYVYKTFNKKQNEVIYKKISCILEDYSKFLPDFYVHNGENISKLFFKEMIEQGFGNKYPKDTDLKAYIISPEENHKALIYSYLNKYFINESLMITGYYKNNKFYFSKFEDVIPEYHELFYNNDRLIRKRWKENYYKINILETLDPKLHRLRKSSKLKKYLSIYNNILNLKDLVSEKTYEMYLDSLSVIETNNEKYKELIKQILKNGSYNLFDKNMFNINEYIDNNDSNRLNIEWLLNIAY